MPGIIKTKQIGVPIISTKILTTLVILNLSEGANEINV